MDTKQLLSKKKGYSVFGLMGFLCAFLWKAERDLASAGNIVWTGSYTAGILIFSLIAGGLAGLGICFLVYAQAEGKWRGLRKREPGLKAGSVFLRNLKTWQVFPASLVLIVLCWLPAYLAYYPGICSYDTTIQLAQIVEGPFNDHHPIAHTLLLKWARGFSAA